MTARDHRIKALRDEARSAKTLTLHIDTRGEVYLGMGLARRLHHGDEVQAVADIIIERMHDPDAPPEIKKETL